VHASNVALQPKLPYDSIKDIAPIAFLGHVGNIVVVHPGVKASSLPELIALAKANPGKVHHGSSGPGTSQHFSGELLKLGTGAEIVHVPYRGSRRPAGLRGHRVVCGDRPGRPAAGYREQAQCRLL
jgi:tripartite-type tricarboxylate transporter receptor subunit TctC